MLLCWVLQFFKCYAECHYDEHHYAEWRYAGCHIYLNVMLSVIMLNAIMQSVVMPNVAAPQNFVVTFLTPTSIKIFQKSWQPCKLKLGDTQRYKKRHFYLRLPSLPRMVRPIEQAPVCLSLKEVIVHAGHRDRTGASTLGFFFLIFFPHLNM